MIERQRKIRPVFKEIPRWMNAYQGHRLNANCPEFHYYSARDETSQPVTLYITSKDSQQPIKMFYNTENFTSSPLLDKDESSIKDFSYLNIE